MAYDFPNMPRDFYIEVSKGNVPGHEILVMSGGKSSINIADAPLDIWNYGGLHTYSSTADIDQLSSSDNSDDQIIEVDGLDSDWNRVIQQKTLTGQTPVNLDTPLIRVYSMYNKGTTDCAGDVYLSTNGAALTLGVPDTPSTVRALIEGSANLSSDCNFSVPVGYSAWLIAFFAGYYVSKATGASFSFSFREFGGVFKSIVPLAVIGSGTSTITHTFITPVFKFAEKTDIKTKCTNIESNDTGLSAASYFLLVKD